MLRQGEEICGQGGMPHTPHFVDWLYQCVLDTVRVLAAHVSAATNVQDEGQSQLCLEGSACKVVGAS